ncbi:MAG: hypothetical protein D6702_04165 [Planctomycetota bacterium]|nr:MAG: hypothetical protein D6702_04165 [Planctomycetota bacterium]
MKREQILLLLTVLFLALLGWGLVGDTEAPRKVRPRSRALELPEAGPLDPVVSLGAGDRIRDPFREPREVEPLPPLELPPPPLGPLAALLPPPVPDAGPAWWSRHLLVQPPLPPGGIDELIDSGEEEGADEAGLDPAEPESFAAAGEGYEAQYDQLRLDARTVLWGRILNENRYDLVPGRDTVLFQEVDPRTGEERFGVQEYGPDRYQAFAFADTLRNRIELRTRALSPSAGAIKERLEFVRWLLDQGLREPLAFVRAEEVARAGVALAPNDVATWMALGEVWERTFRFDEAFALYTRLSGIEAAGPLPDLGLEVPVGAFRRRAAPLVRLGRILERLGLREEAVERYRQAVDLADGDPSAPLALGEALIALGRPEEAAPILERSLSFHASRSSAAALRHGAALGLARLRSGDFAGALADYRDVQSAGGGAAGAALGRCGEVAALYLQGDFERAYAAAVEGVQTFAGDWRLLYLRGICGGAVAAPAAEVIRDLRAAAAAAPVLESAPALAAEAFWLDRLGHADEARLRLAEALEQDPELPYARYLRGRWARQAGEFETARADFRALVGLSSHCAAALGELGWLLHEEGRHAVAEVALRRAQTEAPEWAGIALRRAINLLAFGRPEEAREALAAAEGGAPAAAVRNVAAWAAYLEGDVAGAVAEYALLLDALADREDDPQAVHARTWQARIAEHARLVRWTDEFEGEKPRPQWDVRSQARAGVEPRLEGGRLVIRGTHRATGESMTRALRTVRALDFRSLDAVFVVGPEQRGEGGLMLSLENSRGRATWQFRVYRGPEGRLRWLTRSGTAEPLRGEAAVGAAAGQPIEVSFVLDREQTPPVLTVTAAGETLFSDGVTALRSPSGQLAISLYARTLNALPVDTALERVELVYALPR